MTEQLLISVMLVAPAVGWLLVVAIPIKRNIAIAASTAIVGAASTAWLVCSIAGVIEPAVSVSAGQWLTVSSEPDLAVNLSFQADQSRCMLVLAASLILLLKNTGAVSSENDNERGTALLYSLSIAAILASDLVVLAGIWVLTDCSVVCLLTDRSQPTGKSKRALNTTFILTGSGALLLVATLMAMARFNTSDIGTIVSGSIDDGRVDATTVASGLSVLFVAAVAVRCAFFPALIWPRTCLRIRPRDAAIVIALASVLPGFALAVAVFPLSAVSADAFQLVGILGVLTSFTATGVALVQKDSERIGALLCVGAAGLAASGFAAGLPSCGPTAACTLLAQLVAISVLQRDHVVFGRGIAFGIAMLIAVTGIGGSNAVLSVIESSLQAGQNEIVDAASDRLLLIAWWGILIGQLLWGIAIVKLVMSRPPSETSPGPNCLNPNFAKSSAIASVVATMAACVAICACVTPLDVSGKPNTSPTTLLTFGAATPACLLGMVSAWLLFQAGDNVRSRIAVSLDSLTRLCCEWFYLEDAVRCGLALPIRGLTVVAEFCDRKILGDTSEHAWMKLPGRIAGTIEHLRFQSAVYYGLTGVLLLVGLLWSLR